MKRHWWHCTSDYKGESFVADRRAPRHRAEMEPDTPRLCVSPTIAECFAAVLFDHKGPVYCYRTEVQRSAVKPRAVWDQVVTREGWIVAPVKMLLQRTIATVDVDKAQEWIREYHRCTRKKSSLRIRVAQLSMASEVLGSDWIKDRSRRLCGAIGINDPELYLLGLCDVE